MTEIARLKLPVVMRVVVGPGQYFDVGVAGKSSGRRDKLSRDSHSKTTVLAVVVKERTRCRAHPKAVECVGREESIPVNPGV